MLDAGSDPDQGQCQRHGTHRQPRGLARETLFRLRWSRLGAGRLFASGPLLSSGPLLFSGAVHEVFNTRCLGDFWSVRHAVLYGNEI